MDGPKRNRLIVDTDGGVDDAQAVIMLVSNGVVPMAITTVFGNVDLATATDNLLTVVATLGVDCPVYRGAARALVAADVHARQVHGEDGLGGAARHPFPPVAMSGHAVDFLRSTLSDAARTGEKIDLLMLGPLTNLALALRLDPALAEGIGTLTIMGGTIIGRGNITPSAEFNIFADPEAAQIVFSAPIDRVLVPWETCLLHGIDRQAIDQAFSAASASAASTFSRALADHLMANARSRGRGDRLFCIDPLAAAVVVDPDIITASLMAAVEVSLAPGPARGATLIDPALRIAAPPLRVVEDVDANALYRLYARSVGYQPASPR